MHNFFSISFAYLLFAFMLQNASKRMRIELQQQQLRKIAYNSWVDTAISNRQLSFVRLLFCFDWRWIVNSMSRWDRTQWLVEKCTFQWIRQVFLMMRFPILPFSQPSYAAWMFDLNRMDLISTHFHAALVNVRIDFGQKVNIQLPFDSFEFHVKISSYH